ncbi:MAG: ArsR family transcriptional regulator, partial [Desulfovibrionaceae bacterium]
ANHYVLQTILGEMGHAVSRDQVLADLSWLQDLQLLTTEVLMGTDCPITVAALLNRGEDVAHGRAVVPGIKRPLPGVC